MCQLSIYWFKIPFAVYSANMQQGPLNIIFLFVTASMTSFVGGGSWREKTGGRCSLQSVGGSLQWEEALQHLELVYVVSSNHRQQLSLSLSPCPGRSQSSVPTQYFLSNSLLGYSKARTDKFCRKSLMINILGLLILRPRIYLCSKKATG